MKNNTRNRFFSTYQPTMDARHNIKFDMEEICHFFQVDRTCISGQNFFTRNFLEELCDILKTSVCQAILKTFKITITFRMVENYKALCEIILPKDVGNRNIVISLLQGAFSSPQLKPWIGQTKITTHFMILLPQKIDS